jgi:antitoxin component of MazEF toxin-antitoxin module
MKTEIVRVGNTLTVEIPGEIAARAALKPGDAVEWVARGTGNLALVKSELRMEKKPADMTLEELLEGLSEGDSLGEYDWGAPRGVEIW